MTTIDIREQLMQLRAMTVRTGAIHEAQSLQLRNWPILVPGVKTAQAKVDVENKTVVFDCKSKGKTFRHTKVANEWIRQIDGWTKQILWPETQTVFKVNGKVIRVREEPRKQGPAAGGR